MKYIPSLFFLFIIACNSPKTETTKVPFAQTLKLQGKSAFGIVDQNGDTLIVTSKDTTVSWTYTIYDTTWRRKGSVVVPPVDTIPIPPPVDTSGVPSGYTQTYKTGYDKQSDLDPDNHGQIGNGSLSTTVFRTGPGSFLSRPASVSAGYRSEVQYDQSRTPNDGYTDFWVMFPAYKQTGYGGSCVQWHPGNNNSALFYIYVSDGKFNCVRNVGVPTNQGGTNGSNINQSGTLKSIVSQRWYHIRVFVKWSTGSDGYIKTYLDDMTTPYFTFSGRTQDNSGKPYLKIGQNNWVDSKGQDMHFDDMSIYQK